MGASSPWRGQLLRHGASSSSPALVRAWRESTPQESSGAGVFSTSLAREDIVPKNAIEDVVAVMLLRSEQEAEDHATQLEHDEEINRSVYE